MKTKKGFTLVEVLVSIGIILLIVGFTMPGFSEYAKRKRFERVVGRFAEDVSNLRSRAASGVRSIDNSVSTSDKDAWGMAIYCTAKAKGSPYWGYVGGYYPIYKHTLSNGSDAYNFMDFNNLNNSELTRYGSEFRFKCRGNPEAEIGWDYIFYDLFTGIGSTDIEDSVFSTSDSLTVTIVMEPTGWSKDVVIYKSGVVDVQ
jgi:prepilin-type N-terminal cleavage/methylation domain-containing protein